MKPFFSSVEAQDLLRKESAEWVGTPFVPHAMLKGVGADCVHLLAGIYIACGHLISFDPPKYSLDAGAHRKDSQVFEWLKESPRFELVTDEPIIGDCLCIRQRLSEHHVGLYLGGQHRQFVHAFDRRCVIVSSLNEPLYARRMTAIYRPVERRAD